MRNKMIVSIMATILAVPALAQHSVPSGGGNRPNHPEEVAWIDEGERGFVFRRFPGGQRLYVYDLDHPGRSTCHGGCAAAWPPVPAPADARDVGPWSVIVRSDGSRQWALKGHPVYTRFHDSPQSPTGDGHKGVWHIVPYVSRDLAPKPQGR